MNLSRLPAFIVAVLSALVLFSCRPVLAIGWTELLVIGLVFAALLGPLFLRFYRALQKKSQKKERD